MRLGVNIVDQRTPSSDGLRLMTAIAMLGIVRTYTICSFQNIG